VSSRILRVAAVLGAVATLIVLALFLFRTKTSNQTERAGEPTNSQPAPLPDQRAGQTSPDTTAPSQSSSSLVVNLNDGAHHITLDSRGEIRGLERLPTRVQQAVRSALETGRLPASPQVAQLAGTPSTLLGQANEESGFRLISPVGKVVESDRPEFSWSALAGAHSYTVTITDPQLNEVATSGPLTTTKWRVAKSLKLGAVYSWQATALKDGKAVTAPVLPAPQAKFKVVERDALQTLQQVKRSYPGSHLAVGVLYAESGLYAEAERELRALVRANPNDRVARELLRSLQAMLR
jgi:hypothetical protein